MTPEVVEAQPSGIRLRVPFTAKSQIKEIPGARWEPSTKTWVFPGTRHAAESLVRAFPELDDALPLIPLREKPPRSWQATNALETDFRTKLWEHQRRAVNFAFPNQATMLAMEMRTGKTAVSIALAHLWNCQRVLVTCPLSVVGVWEAEVARHSGQPWRVVRLDRGGVPAKMRLLSEALAWQQSVPVRARPPLLVVVNHESLWRDPLATTVLDAFPSWDLLIVDESHRAKAPGGKFSRFLARLGDQIPRRLALTGTPLPHSPLDAYAQYRFLDRSIFGTSYNRMRNRYAIMGGYGGHEIKQWQNMDEFSQRFHEIAFEVKTQDAFDLPDEMDIRRSIALEPGARKVYESMLQNFWAEVESGEVTASNALTKLLRLQQITSGWIKNDDGEMVCVSDAKQRLFADFLEDFPVGEPLVVFVRFIADIDAVRGICLEKGRSVGEVSGRHKDLTEAGTFPDDLDTMVVQIQSGSLGVNLSRASTAVFYSWGWSLGDVEQARARIRHGEKIEKLQFVHMVIENSIDERMMGCLQNRRDFIEDVLERGRECG